MFVGTLPYLTLAGAAVHSTTHAWQHSTRHPGVGVGIGRGWAWGYFLLPSLAAVFPFPYLYPSFARLPSLHLAHPPTSPKVPYLFVPAQHHPVQSFLAVLASAPPPPHLALLSQTLSHTRLPFLPRSPLLGFLSSHLTLFLRHTIETTSPSIQNCRLCEPNSTVDPKAQLRRANEPNIPTRLEARRGEATTAGPQDAEILEHNLVFLFSSFLCVPVVHSVPSGFSVNNTRPLRLHKLVRNMRTHRKAPPQHQPDAPRAPRHEASPCYGHGKLAPSLPLQAMISSRPLPTPNQTARSFSREHRYLPSLSAMDSGRRRPRPRPPHSSFPSAASSILGMLLITFACLLIQPAAAVLIPFDNCLDSSYTQAETETGVPNLQWNALYVDARFDNQDPAHNLQIIVWGNVTGSYTVKTNDTVPSPNDPSWNDPSSTFGKILERPDEKNLTTLQTRVNVLSYQPFYNRSAFCNDSLVNGSCPLAPVFKTV